MSAGGVHISSWFWGGTLEEGFFEWLDDVECFLRLFLFFCFLWLSEEEVSEEEESEELLEDKDEDLLLRFFFLSPSKQLN